ncbi:hypothetical protein GALMADRAFT_133951, partial [Galerina marginata CBS 339.88]
AELAQSIVEDSPPLVTAHTESTADAAGQAAIAADVASGPPSGDVEGDPGPEKEREQDDGLSNEAREARETRIVLSLAWAAAEHLPETVAEALKLRDDATSTVAEAAPPDAQESNEQPAPPPDGSLAAHRVVALLSAAQAPADHLSRPSRLFTPHIEADPLTETGLAPSAHVARANNPSLPYPAVPPGLRNFVHTARARAAARLTPSLILTYGPFTPDTPPHARISNYAHDYRIYLHQTYAADRRFSFGYGNHQIFAEPPMLLTMPEIEDDEDYAPLSCDELDLVEEITSLLRSDLPSDHEIQIPEALLREGADMGCDRAGHIVYRFANLERLFSLSVDWALPSPTSSPGSESPTAAQFMARRPHIDEAIDTVDADSSAWETSSSSSDDSILLSPLALDFQYPPSSSDESTKRPADDTYIHHPPPSKRHKHQPCAMARPSSMPDLSPNTNSPSSSFELLEKPTSQQIFPRIGTPFATRLMTLLDHDIPQHFIDTIKDTVGTGIMGYGPFNMKATWTEEAEEDEGGLGDLPHRYRVFLAQSTDRDAREVFRYEGSPSILFSHDQIYTLPASISPGDHYHPLPEAYEDFLGRLTAYLKGDWRYECGVTVPPFLTQNRAAIGHDKYNRPVYRFPDVEELLATLTATHSSKRLNYIRSRDPADEPSLLELSSVSYAVQRATGSMHDLEPPKLPRRLVIFDTDEPRDDTDDFDKYHQRPIYYGCLR